MWTPLQQVFQRLEVEAGPKRDEGDPYDARFTGDEAKLQREQSGHVHQKRHGPHFILGLRSSHQRDNDVVQHLFADGKQFTRDGSALIGSSGWQPKTVTLLHNFAAPTQ